MTQHLKTEADRPATKPTDEIKVTPEMIEAGVDVLRSYMFADGSVLRSDHAEIVEAIWRAIDHALTSKSESSNRRSKDEYPKSSAPIVLMERESSELGREYLVWPPDQTR